MPLLACQTEGLGLCEHGHARWRQRLGPAIRVWHRACPEGLVLALHCPAAAVAAQPALVPMEGGRLLIGMSRLLFWPHQMSMICEHVLLETALCSLRSLR